MEDERFTPSSSSWETQALRPVLSRDCATRKNWVHDSLEALGHTIPVTVGGGYLWISRVSNANLTLHENEN